MLLSALGAFVLILAACAAGPDMPPATREWLSPYAEALKFVPPGMQSHWFASRSYEAIDGEPARSWREVYAGRDFEPTWDIGVGPYVGVSVFDYGVGGALLEEFRGSATEKRAAVGGCPVWCSVEQKLDKSGARSPRESWSALVDDRFLVTATSEALLHDALRRDHSPRFGSLEPLPVVPSEATDLVLRELACVPPPMDKPPGTNPGGVSGVFAFVLPAAGEPGQLFLWAKDEEDLSALLGFIGLRAKDLRPMPTGSGRYAACPGTPLVCFVLFGFSVFV
ncbi:MAG: hypothetical protein JNK78_20570 [Planctomycetes bacterium]|nr:hypothetical protein [Planctomycetota bacterium]